MMNASTNSNRPLEAVDDWWDRHGVDAETTVTVYVRSYVPPPASHDSRRHLLNTLSFADDRDRIRGHEFRVIGDELCLCSDCRPTYRDSGLLETVARLCAWTDGRLESSGFTTRTVRNGTTGERYRTLVPPVTAVAVSRDDALCGVFPCEVAGETYGLDAFLTDLQEAVIAERPAGQGPAGQGHDGQGPDGQEPGGQEPAGQEPGGRDPGRHEILTGGGSELGESRRTDGAQNTLD